MTKIWYPSSREGYLEKFILISTSLLLHQISLDGLSVAILYSKFSRQKSRGQLSRHRRDSSRCRIFLWGYLAQKHDKQLITDGWRIHPDIARSELV
jgi:hypothetical protein